jgi:hypothetical protein
MRQQPVAARACGFGERDRRVIDPPPILEMIRRGSADELAESRYQGIVHCTLWHAEEDRDDGAVPCNDNSARRQRRLMGTLVASTFAADDEHGRPGRFFTFPDLSCRTSGRYRLRFVLVLLDLESMCPAERAPFHAVLLSQPFAVFAAKDFPGMRPSTALSRRLRDQGCMIPVKKGGQVEEADEGRGAKKRRTR